MEDTSPTQNRPAPPSPAMHRIASPTTDSPTLGRQANSPQRQASLAEDVRRKQHFMAWNDYGAAHVDDVGGEEHEMQATISPKSPPASATKQSPVSALGSLDRDAR